MVHNHNWEFQRVFGDRTAYDILMAYTDPRNVVFQLDLYWATNGGGLANPVELLERYGNRIQLFHVKDMAAGPFPGRIEIVGEGIIDFPSIFAASQGPVRYYVVEHDPRFGDRRSTRSKPRRRASTTSAASLSRTQPASAARRDASRRRPRRRCCSQCPAKAGEVGVAALDGANDPAGCARSRRAHSRTAERLRLPSADAR